MPNSDDELLRILQSHGETFLSSFSGSTQGILKKKPYAAEITAHLLEEEEEEEWGGIGTDRDVSESEEGMFTDTNYSLI